MPHTVNSAPPSIVAVTTAALRSVSSADLTLLSPTGVYTMVHTGIGSFDAATAVYAAIGLTALAAADLDQDGRADLIIASTDGSILWYICAMSTEPWLNKRNCEGHACM